MYNGTLVQIVRGLYKQWTGNVIHERNDGKVIVLFQDGNVQDYDKEDIEEVYK